MGGTRLTGFNPFQRAGHTFGRGALPPVRPTVFSPTLPNHLSPIQRMEGNDTFGIGRGLAAEMAHRYTNIKGGRGKNTGPPADRIAYGSLFAPNLGSKRIPAAAFTSARALVKDPPRLPDGSLDENSLPLVARAVVTIIRSAASRYMQPLAADLDMGMPLKFWGALILLADGAPKGIVESLCLEWRPHIGTDGIMDIYDRVLAADGVRDGLSLAEEIGLHRFLETVGALHKPDVAEEATTAERAIAGFGFVERAISDGWDAAVADHQAMGLEVEFLPWTALSGIVAHEYVSRDDIYRMIERKLRKRGFKARHIPVPTDFHVSPNSHFFPTLTEEFQYRDHNVDVRRVNGRNNRHSATIFDHKTGRTQVVISERDSVFGESRDTYRAVANLLGLKSIQQVEELKRMGVDHYRAHYSVTVKDERNDIAKLDMEFMGDGHARVTSPNAGFNGHGREPEREIVIPATSFREAVETIEGMSRENPRFLRKLDGIIGIRVAGLRGQMMLLYEQHLLQELVTQKTTPSHFDVIEAAIEALAEAHFVGTTDQTSVGVHCHGNVPITVDGKFSVAPMLGLLRAFLENADAIYSIVPVNPGRRRYIMHIPPSLHALITRKNYVSDPSDPAQMLCVMADIVMQTEDKFNELNLDNLISKLGEEMLRAGIFKNGERLTVENWHGERYEFVFGVNEIALMHKGRERKLLRVPGPSRKTTAELRIFNTVHRNRRPHEYTIDVASIMWFLRFWTAYVHTHAALPFESA